MINDILDLTLFSILNIGVIYAIYEFNETYFNKRYLYDKRINQISYISFYFLSSVFYFLNLSSYLNVLSSFILNFFILGLYKANIKSRIVISSLIMILMMSIEVLIGILGTIIFNVSIEEIIQENSATIFLMSTSRIIPLIIVHIYKFCVKGNQITNSNDVIINGKLGFIFVIPILNIISIVIITTILHLENLGETSSILTMVIVILISLINVFFFYIYNNIVALFKNRMDNLLLNQQINYYNKEFNQIQTNLLEVRKIKHDLKYKLINILSQSTNNDELDSDEISELINEIENIDYRIYSKNVSLDTILNYQINQAKSKGISVDIDVKINVVITIEGKYLCVIVGNILENAIENCSNVKKPYIKINILQENGSFYMSVTNPYNNSIKLENDKFISSKVDSQNHGFGIKSIQDLVFILSGVVNIDIKSDKFTINFIIFD